MTPFAKGSFLSLALVFLTAWGNVCHARSFYVSPEGNDSNPGTADQPFQTIVRARDAVRAVNGTATNDITVYLAGGLYRLTNSLVFTSADSGQHGYHVIYQALPGQTPVLDGGILVANWSLHDATRNIWRAPVPAGAAFRQLYVNGVKANFTRSPDALGLVETSTGYSSSNAFLLALSNSTSVASLEVVTCPELWQREILPVAAITPGGNVTLQQPCWNMVKSDVFPSYKKPIWLQNAYEFLTNPGDWYLQAASNTVYYIPRPGDNLATAVVEAPVLERLIYLQGSVFGPVSNLRFEGISFQMTTWNLVGPGYGFPESQANQPEYSSSNWVVKAAVDGAWLRDVDVSQCQFSNLGGNGVNILYGSKHVTIDHCQFSNLSAGAVQVGLGWSPDGRVSATDPSIIENILIANNTIHDVCTDYPSGCGIFAGYTRNCTITHNHLYNLPYAGISLGWGWGKKVAFTVGNKILNNKIHDHLQVLADSGGIYCNGVQENGLIEGNYIYNQGNLYGDIYLDDGSTHWRVRHNVCKSGKEEEWYLFKGHDNHAEENYTDGFFVRDMNDGSEPCSVNDTKWVNKWISAGNSWVAFPDNWPKAARDIMNAAGPVVDPTPAESKP